MASKSYHSKKSKELETASIKEDDINNDDLDIQSTELDDTIKLQQYENQNYSEQSHPLDLVSKALSNFRNNPALHSTHSYNDLNLSASDKELKDNDEVGSNKTLLVPPDTESTLEHESTMEVNVQQSVEDENSLDDSQISEHVAQKDWSTESDAVDQLKLDWKNEKTEIDLDKLHEELLDEMFD